MPIYQVERNGRVYEIDAPTPRAAAAAFNPKEARGVTNPASVRVTNPPAWNEPGGVLLDTVRRLSQFLPLAGGLAGGALGGVAGPPGAIGGATLGGAFGESVKQLTNRALGGIPVPSTPIEAATNIASEGAIQGMAQAGGEALALGGSKLAGWLMNRATTRVTKRLATEFPELSDTLIDRALTVSSGGYDKAKALLKVAKGKANAALKAAELGGAGATIPVEVTPEIADSLRTAIIEQAVRGGRAREATAAVSMATRRLDAPTQALLGQIDQVAQSGGTLDLLPTQADLLKTQLQRESRALYWNRLGDMGRKAMPAEATLKAEFASRLNDAIDAVASGYKLANAEAQPLIGAVRGLKQAIRPSGNLYQAMVRPGIGAIGGGYLGQRRGHPIAGAIAGAALTSPAGLSREAIALRNPAIQELLRQTPRLATVGRSKVKSK